MKQNQIQFYIYPDGIADSMGQDELVLVRNKLGSSPILWDKMNSS
jgi:hypothetical protein